MYLHTYSTYISSTVRLTDGKWHHMLGIASEQNQGSSSAHTERVCTWARTSNTTNQLHPCRLPDPLGADAPAGIRTYMS